MLDFININDNDLVLLDLKIISYEEYKNYITSSTQYDE